MSNEHALIAEAVNADVTLSAGFWRRGVALVIDGVILALLNIPIGALVGNSNDLLVGYLRDSHAPISPESLKKAAYGLTAEIIIQVIYCSLFYRAVGATPGKFLLGLRVINRKTGAFLGVGQTILREVVGKWISFLLLLSGFLMVAFRKDKRALHDLIADTQVLLRK